MSSFPPIAVIAHSCVLPGAFNPAELWQAIASGTDLLGSAPAGYWRVDSAPLLDAKNGRAAIASDRGGYVTGFEPHFKPEDFELLEDAGKLDQLFQWVLWGAREALEQAGHDWHKASPRAGLVIGNLGYPSPDGTRYAEAVWMGKDDRPFPVNRFHFGKPATSAAKALRLGLGGFSLDAACASSLYAIKLACDRLHDGEADLMVAGGVNRSDSLFLHAGFTALGALSLSGRSLPFHRAADGLLPSEGAAFVVLRTLQDAVVAGDRILGVIRGVGLSNDGRASGLLTPSAEGQIRAMRDAYRMADLKPHDISYVECHATGTPIGDDTEIRSMDAIFGSVAELAVGSLKSNLGHLMTAAGAAGLVKVLEALKAEMLPGMRNADQPSPAMQSSRFRIASELRPWTCSGPRRAAVSAFGFGGNNAHLIVEQWMGEVPGSTPVAFPRTPIAITGLSAIASDGRNASDLLHVLAEGQKETARASRIELVASALRFPPRDLEDCDGQHLLILQAATEALADSGSPSGTRVGVFIGIEPSAEIARHCAAWRIAGAIESASPQWLDELFVALPPLSRASTVLGTMPNMPANRLNSQYDWRGPGFVVGAGEDSGEAALRIAMRALRCGEIDLAVVGAAGLCQEPVHASAVQRPTGDAATVLVLRRKDEADETSVYAFIDDHLTSDPGVPVRDLSVSWFGDSYAAAGLLDVAIGALCCRYRLKPREPGSVAQFWIPRDKARRAGAGKLAIGASRYGTFLPDGPVPRLHFYCGEDRAEVLEAATNGEQSSTGTARLVIAAANPQELERRLRQAEQLLQKSEPVRNAVLGEGIYYADSPVTGELGFVFTGAGAAYPGMGKSLLWALPQLVEDTVWGRLLEGDARWIYEETDLARIATDQYLYGASFLSQAHAQFTLQVLQLRPTAALGLSSGESNSLFALGAWKDPVEMFRDVAESGLYNRELGAPFNAVRQAWGLASDEPVNWVTWRVAVPVGRIRRVLEDEPRVKLLIVHHDNDALIGGQAPACERVLRALGSPPAQLSTHNLAIHCSEVAGFSEHWWKIHCRQTSPVPGIRFYTNATGDYYTPDDRTTADMLLRQATETVDFRRTVLKAWEDGVRVFVEHGPRNLCSEWIGRILGDRPYLSVPLDRAGKSSVVQAIHAAAQLSAAGIDIDVTAFSAQPPQVRPQPAKTLGFPAHPPPVVIPFIEDIEHAMQPMPAAPLLPEAEPEPTQVIRMPVARPCPVATVGAVSPSVMAIRASGDALQAALNQHVEVLRLTLATRLRFVPVVGQKRAPGTVAAGGNISKRRFNRDEILIHASEKISEIFGDLFRQQDGYTRQVRMPEEPMLLVDRVTDIEGEPGSMGAGTVWTETDIREDSWYVHERRIPAGILIEAGQADLMLVSWLGADLANRGERVYRLLGCDLTWHGELPKIGDTLRYEIHIDGYAKQGQIRLFFFHYDCRVGERLALSVRNGQAGFFTDEELAQSAGVIWNPETAVPRPGATVLEPVVQPRNSCSAKQLRLFADGRTWECFGAGYEYAGPHKLSPRIPNGRLLLLDEITHLEPKGGPWKRGYMRAKKTVSSSDWFFHGHFKNDPCMPGTLMAEACQQALSFYLAALGFTVDRDAWRFEPAAEECSLRCRGQVTPSSRELVYELFVEELTTSPLPVVFADILVTADGLKALHAHRMGVRLVPDWPLEGRLELNAEDYLDLRPAAGLGGFPYDRRSTLESALGRPSKAFGPHFQNYDGPLRMARLPAPPFNFVSRLSRVEEPPGGMRNGILIETEYALRESDWFLRENGAPVMPLSILMEITIQPCGWSSVYGIQDEPHNRDRFFRNLDGTATLLAPIRGTGLVRSVIRMTSISRSAEIILTSFDVEAYLDDKLVYTLKTGCGFFSKEALANQAGLPANEEELRRYNQPSDIGIDLTSRPDRYFRRSARLPDSRLLMVDRITGFWEGQGAAGIARLRSQKDIRPDEWFLKAHFFQDPVQPGSLGVEAMNQTLQFYMLHMGLDAELVDPQFEAFALGETHSWRYRGQVLPTSRKMDVELEILEVRREETSVTVRADAWLWVDGFRIYQAKNIAARLRADRVRQSAAIVRESATTVLVPSAAALKAWWDKEAPAPSTEAAERLVASYCCKFVRRVAAVSPERIQELHGCPMLFVANHQNITESMLFPLVAPLITGSRVTTLAKMRVKEDRLVQALLGVLQGRLQEPILYIDQSDPRSLIDAADRLRKLLQAGESVLIHAQGIRTFSCREPVAKVSSIVAEIAMDAQVPVVPVRFYGGLPVTPVDYKIDFPFGYGSQDYILGLPILPQHLSQMDLKARKQAIVSGINCIPPLPSEEQPNPADPEFQAGVTDRIHSLGITEAEAVLLECLAAPADSRLADRLPFL